MAINPKPTLIPKLRFPEFQNQAGWETKCLAPFLEEAGERVPSKTDLPIYSSTRTGLRRQDDYYDGKILLNKNDYGVVPVGCFVYRHMSDDGLFKFNINDTGEDIAVSKEYPVFRALNLDPKFLLSKLNYGSDFEKFAMSQKAGGTRTRLYFSKLSTWETAIPSLAEQQKIAECLSTLDEVIGAESQRLDALKAHKKGLMQQLLPREGETLPRLRFPEFRGAWDESNLGALSAGISSGRDEKVPGGPFDLYGSTGVIGKTSSATFVGTFLLVARVGANAGFVAKTSGSFGVTDNVLVIDLIEKKSSDFIFYYLGNLGLNKMIFGSGQPLITGRQLKALPIMLPCKSEREKISSCLSSLDELIAAESDKLEALKTHKQGLMQQLFPSPAEV